MIDYEEINRYAMKMKARMNGAAQRWTINDRNHVVGSFDAHNKYEDYNTYIFNPIHNHCGSQEATIFEFGCGVGRNIVKWFDECHLDDFICGVDISSVALEKAREWLHHNDVPRELYDLKEINGYDLNNIESNKFDAVYSTIALQHIPRYDVRFNLFKEFYRILNDTGMIALQMGFGPGKKFSVRYHENIVAEDVRDTCVESIDDLRNDLDKIGFKNFECNIRPVGPGDTHPNWIFFRTWK